MPNPVYKAAITQNSEIVYIGGGADFSGSVNHLQSLDLSNLLDFQDAQNRNWISHKPLKTTGKLGTIQFYENFLFYNGVAGTRSESRNVEIYDLKKENSTLHFEVLNFWSDMSAAFISGGNWTIFGGDAASSSCMMQSQFIGNFDDHWECIESNLLDSFSLQVSYVNVN